MGIVPHGDVELFFDVFVVEKVVSLFYSSAILKPVLVFHLKCSNVWASLVAQMVKIPPAMQETWVQSLDWEEPLEESMATHSSILAWKIPKDRGAWQTIVHGVTKSQT